MIISVLIFALVAITPLSVKADEPAAPSPAETITNSIGMKLTLIPAGEFTMGAPS